MDHDKDWGFYSEWGGGLWRVLSRRGPWSHLGSTKGLVWLRGPIREGREGTKAIQRRGEGNRNQRGVWRLGGVRVGGWGPGENRSGEEQASGSWGCGGPGHTKLVLS